MRLITRGDVDGLACAIFITTMEKIDSIKFAHPKDVQDGLVEATPNDIICNLPYAEGCHMWFDHHISEESRDERVQAGDFEGKYGLAPSAARLVYEYYDSPRLKKYDEFLEAVDKMDAAQLDMEDVTNPTGWMLLLFSLDPRTRLGDFEYYFFQLIDWIKAKSLTEIMKEPEVDLRCEYVISEQEKYTRVLEENSRQDGNVVITDLREVREIPMGNRFLIYTIYPEANISLQLFKGKEGLKIVVAGGHNIFKRDSNTNIGDLFSKYGGGGHRGAGTCQLDPDKTDELLEEIIAQMKADG